jgi:sirohydrochlorin ferrochelatase
VILVGHGSKARGFDRAMKRVAAALRRGPYRTVQCAYLEINSPSISEAIRQAVRRGAREVRVLPYFLLAGNHVRKDIPAIIASERKRQRSKTRIFLRPYLGYDPKIVSVVRERISDD